MMITNHDQWCSPVFIMLTNGHCDQQWLCNNWQEWLTIHSCKNWNSWSMNNWSIYNQWSIQLIHSWQEWLTIQEWLTTGKNGQWTKSNIGCQLVKCQLVCWWSQLRRDFAGCVETGQPPGGGGPFWSGRWSPSWRSRRPVARWWSLVREPRRQGPAPPRWNHHDPHHPGSPLPRIVRLLIL